MDQIFVQNLSVRGHHGVLPEERRLGQTFLVSLTLETDLQKAVRSDDLTDTVNYAEVADLVTREIGQTRFQLLEALAGHLFAALWKAFPSIHAITIDLRKPAPPIPLPLEAVGIRLRRERPDQI